MKRFTKVLGIFTITLTSLGILLKILHWPGGSSCLFFGVLSLSFVFLPVFLLQKIKKSKTIPQNLQVVFGLISAMTMCMSLLFLFQHWPGGIVLGRFSLGVLIFLYLPAFIFSNIDRKKAV